MSNINTHGSTVYALGEVCRTITDGTHLPPRFTDKGVPFLFVRNIVRGAIDFDVEKYISQMTYDELTKKHKAEQGDVLFSAVGSFGVAVVVRTDAQFAFQRHIAHIKPDTSRIDADFLTFFLNSPQGRSQSEAVALGGAQRTVTLAALRRFRIPVPPLEKQRQISADLAASLAVVSSAGRAAQDRLAVAEALHAASLREVFEGPEASHWRKTYVRDVAEISGGIQKSPARAPVKHHHPYLTVRNVQRGSLDLSQVERFEVTPSELERLRLRKGDLLLVEGNGSPDQIGRNAVFDLDGSDWIHQNHVIRVRLSEAATYRFVSFFLNSPAGKAQMIERARSTSGLYTLSTHKIGSLEIPLPGLEDQVRISRYLSHRLEAVNSVISRCREECTAIEALPSALLRSAFNANA
jgi:type I restriction enzyme S subunit